MGVSTIRANYLEFSIGPPTCSTLPSQLKKRMPPKQMGELQAFLASLFGPYEIVELFLFLGGWTEEHTAT